MKLIDLVVFAIVFIVFLTFAQLSVRALDIEQAGTAQLVNDHKAYLANSQVQE